MNDYGTPLKRGMIIMLTVICMAVTYYFHFLRREDVVFSHFFYIPIVLAGAWWGWETLLVSGVLGANLIASSLISGLSNSLDRDLTRAAMFIVVGAVLGAVVERKNRHEARARDEHRRYISQMERHLAYVERVSHELRNPLQVTLGVLDSLEDEPDPGRREEFVRLLSRSADSMRTRIQELTEDARKD
jgi:signal transduction histidine kinase